MTVVAYAHNLASRIPELAKDCTINNAYMIARELEELFEEVKNAQRDTARVEPVRAGERREA